MGLHGKCSCGDPGHAHTIVNKHAQLHIPSQHRVMVFVSDPYDVHSTQVILVCLIELTDTRVGRLNARAVEGPLGLDLCPINIVDTDYSRFVGGRRG